MSSTDNPFIETKSIVPATAGAILAAILTLVIGLIVLFSLRPPIVTGLFGPMLFDLSVIAQLVQHVVMGVSCPAGLMKIIGVDCRLTVLQQAGDVIAASQTATISVGALFAAPVLTAAVTYAQLMQVTPKREGVRTLQGSRPLFDTDARAGLRARIAQTGATESRNLWIAPHVQLTHATEGYNLLAIGTQGSGKTSTLRAMIEQMIDRGDRVVVHDVKGDMTAGLPTDRAVLIAPHDARSWAYDIAADIRNHQHAKEFAAHAIQPSNHDAMWGQGAQAIWADLVMALRAETDGQWSWPELAEALLAPGQAIKERLEGHGSTHASRLVFGSADPEENRTTMSLLVTLWVAALTVVEPLARAWAEVPERRRFSLRAWMAPKTRLPRVVILQKSTEYPELSKRACGFLVDRLIGLALRPGSQRNPNERLALCIDELPEWSKLEKLPNLLNVGREFGIVTLAAVQDIASLVDLYGENATEVLLARFRIKLVHQLGPGDTAQRISTMLGDRLIEYSGPARRDPRSGTISRDVLQKDVLVLPVGRLETELGPRREQGQTVIRVLVMGLGNPAILDIPLTAWKDRRRGHVPASWLEER